MPIKSLSPSWLWCEAWCAGGSENRTLENAKVVDFCVDPNRLNESKFEKAKRLISDYEQRFLVLRDLIKGT